MKFSKFVKSLAPDGGAIYEYMGKRWLASPSVLMLIPDGIRSVTGYSNEKMPDGIWSLDFSGRLHRVRHAGQGNHA